MINLYDLYYNFIQNNKQRSMIIETYDCRLDFIKHNNDINLYVALSEGNKFNMRVDKTKRFNQDMNFISLDGTSCFYLVCQSIVLVEYKEVHSLEIYT